MPIYEYQCDQCNTSFEVRASFQEKEKGLKPMCPTCEGVQTHHVLSGSLFLRGGIRDTVSASSTCCGPNSTSGCCGG